VCQEISSARSRQQTKQNREKSRILAYSSTLKMDAICSSETLDSLRTTRRYNTKHLTFHLLRLRFVFSKKTEQLYSKSVNISRILKIPPKRLAVTELHDITTEKTLLLAVTAVRTSDPTCKQKYSKPSLLPL
jgi:hypothetical protein